MESSKTLLDATLAGDVKAVTEALQYGASVNCRDKKGWTPLHMAAAGNKTTVIPELLVHLDAKINAKTTNGQTPLHVAAWNNATDISELFIHSSANLNATDDEGQTPLHVSTWNNAAAISKKLILAEADVNVKDNQGLNPIHWEAGNNTTATLKLLIQWDAIVNTANNEGWTPLHWAAAYSKSASVLELLIHEGADIHARNNLGQTPVDIAAQYNTKAVSEILKQLIKNHNAKKDEIPHEMADKRHYLMVAALDFGTTHSGYAYSMRHEFELDPLNIHANQIWKGREPTCLLLTGNKEFVAFGFDAEAQYADKLKKHEDCYYFHRFKMNLHDNQNITHNMVLEDIRGQCLPAVTVFKFSIRALVDHLMAVVQRMSVGITKHDIRWVLTIHAIWRDTAKEFMRTCAEEAGIPKDRLILALGTETASIFCQYLPTEKLQGSSSGFTMTETGTKYMVVDIGGGTADITVHQKASNGQLKELYRASGNDCGGTSVDKRFFNMLEQILGKEVMKDLQENNPISYLDLAGNFDIVKRIIDSKMTRKINIVIPAGRLNATCNAILQKDLKSVIGSSAYAGKIVLYMGRLRIDADVIRNLFKPTVDNITSIMKDILRDSSTEGVTMLVMVGGFSECQILQDAIRQEFPDKRIIIPIGAETSMLCGAVLFGHRPGYIQSRSSDVM